ncbi:MAG: EF-hand protein [Chthoniobacteraceae bacterium]|nr:EF-hand protein [Chthoniobacteraceae bacterium]MDB6172804.1 EF-hand protein [Chthoniobacteraceae bacterium]
MKTLSSILAVLALSTTLSFAADETKPADKPAAAEPAAEKPKRDPAEAFKKLDADNDGFVSADEFKKSPQAQRAPEKADENFKKRDTNSDGKLDLAEFSAKRGGKKAK